MCDVNRGCIRLANKQKREREKDEYPYALLYGKISTVIVKFSRDVFLLLLTFSAFTKQNIFCLLSLVRDKISCLKELLFPSVRVSYLRKVYVNE